MTDEMIKFYKTRTEAHIDRVLKWTKVINKAKGLSLNFDNHDNSKWLEPEKTPYIYLSWYYKRKKDGFEYNYPVGVKTRIDAAVQHHYDVNPHHPEFHAESLDKPMDARGMSYIDISEMCADWMAMSEEMENDPIEWADKVLGEKFHFDEFQTKYIYDLLALYAENTEASYIMKFKED